MYISNWTSQVILRQLALVGALASLIVVSGCQVLSVEEVQARSFVLKKDGKIRGGLVAMDDGSTVLAIRGTKDQLCAALRSSPGDGVVSLALYDTSGQPLLTAGVDQGSGQPWISLLSKPHGAGVHASVDPRGEPFIIMNSEEMGYTVRFDAARREGSAPQLQLKIHDSKSKNLGAFVLNSDGKTWERSDVVTYDPPAEPTVPGMSITNNEFLKKLTELARSLAGLSKQ